MAKDVQHQFAVVAQRQLEQVAPFGVERSLLVRIPDLRGDPARALRGEAQLRALRVASARLSRQGHRRHEVRTRWWDINADTFRTAAILDRAERDALPDTPIPESALLGYESNVPVFFGHYWWSGNPAPLMPRVACVDYSAGKGGPLVAYRWEGESVLDAGNFVGARYG
jgi:hypothetical protein